MLDLLLFCVALIHMLAEELSKPFSGSSTRRLGGIVSGAAHLLLQPKLLLAVVESNYYTAKAMSRNGTGNPPSDAKKIQFWINANRRLLIAGFRKDNPRKTPRTLTGPQFVSMTDGTFSR